MSVPMPLRVRQLAQQCEQDRARAGAEVGDAQRPRAFARRSISASASSTTVSVSGRGTSTAGVTMKRQPPEFLRADDARDRLAGEPARRQRLRSRPLALAASGCVAAVTSAA